MSSLQAVGMTQPLLELRNVTKDFRIGGGLGLTEAKTIRAVDGISFTIPGGNPSITALVGESGSGKSTTARLILGLLKLTSGEVLYRGKDTRVWLGKDRMTYRREVQVIFQDPYSIYNPLYRVERILYMAIKKFGLASSRNEAHEMIIGSMRAMGLRPEDLLGRYPHQISGGERQRLMLVRILLMKPRLVVADEPVSMIDVSLRSIFLDNLLDLKNRIKMSCLYITHDLNIANYVADQMIVLCYGRIVETGRVQSLVEEPLHPYTQTLISAIPVPDPRKRWKDTVKLEASTFKELRVEGACIFVNRCPHVMPTCRKSVPPLREVKEGHEAACFLYA